MTGIRDTILRIPESLILSDLYAFLTSFTVNEIVCIIYTNERGSRHKRCDSIVNAGSIIQGVYITLILGDMSSRTSNRILTVSKDVNMVTPFMMAHLLISTPSL